MKKKRWFYLIFLTLIFIAFVFIIFFIKPIYKMLNESGLLDRLSFFYYLQNNSFVESFKNFLKINITNYTFSFFGINNTNIFIFKIFFLIFKYLFSTLSLKIYKTFFKQAERCIHYEKINIIKSGILSYGIFILVILIFMFSIVGYAVSMIFHFILMLLVMIGETALGMYIGNKATNKDNIFVNMSLGMLFMDIFYFIPYLDSFVYDTIIPILSLGTIIQNFYNMFILRKYYEKNNSSNKKNVLDKDEIYDIIVSDRKGRNDNE